jgi:vacuolar-type H+-ATPase subunit H
VAIEQIKMIKEIEDQADQVRRKAQGDGKQMVLDAEKEAARLVEQARKDADTAYKSALTKAEAEADAVYAEILEKAKSVCDVISEAAEKNQEAAVTKIIGRVVK